MSVDLGMSVDAGLGDEPGPAGVGTGAAPLGTGSSSRLISSEHPPTTRARAHRMAGARRLPFIAYSPFVFSFSGQPGWSEQRSLLRCCSAVTLLTPSQRSTGRG